ncbi:MAG: hypothetical protein ACFCUQ_13235 [Kiloniellales bacterium]
MRRQELKLLPVAVALALAAAFWTQASLADDAFSGVEAVALDDSQLDQVRGGQDVNSHNNLAQGANTATQTNSSSLSATTVNGGNVHVSGEAFGHFSGMNTFVMNTGNQNDLVAASALSLVFTE